MAAERLHRLPLALAAETQYLKRIRMLVLYTTAISANGRKALAVAKHLELNIDVRSVDVYRGEGRTADYLKINPSGKVPTLVDEEFILWESNAILVHLAEAHGNFVLSSRDNMTRADILPHIGNPW